MNENITDPRVKIIENATRDDVQAGDHVVWESTETNHGVTNTYRREGIAHHRDGWGDWRAAEGGLITNGEGQRGTITIRRPVKQLPKTADHKGVIVTNDGYEAIEATTGGLVWRTSEAVLGADGLWHGVWRGPEGWGAVTSIDPEKITPDTWKVDDQ